MYVSVTIKPAVSPMDRGVVEDMVFEALTEATGNEPSPLGGGTMLGEEPESDFDFEIEGEAAVIERVCREVLSEISFTKQTALCVKLGDGEPFTLVVGGDAKQKE